MQGSASDQNFDQNDPVNSSDAAQDLDFPGDDDWVIVKKLRVTIWIPPLPRLEHSSMPNSAPAPRLYDLPTEEVNNTSNFPTKRALTSRKCLSVKVDKTKASLSTTKGVSFARKAYSLLKQKKLLFRSNDLNQVVASKATPRERYPALRHQEASSAVHCLGDITQPRLMPGLTYLSDGSTLLSKAIRASNLERKLIRAGGLSRCLASLGLSQFIRIFKGRNVGKFQLVNISMKKLKDMGAYAMGPRRKLIHATDCLCQPPCFQAIYEQ